MLAISEGTRRSVIDAGVDPAKVTFLPNAMRTDEIRFSAEGRARVRAELGIPADAFTVGCISRFHPKKRNDVVIDAVRMLGEDTHLILAGSGETEAELRERAAPLGPRAHFLPTPGAEVGDVLSAFDVSVFCPSPAEGQPRAVILGMLAERPCVSTGAEGVIGLIEEEFGAIVSPENDPGALAEVLRRYVGDPERRPARGRAGGAARRAINSTAASVAEQAERLLRDAGREESMSEPLRALFVDEGVLGHRTLSAQLRAALADDPTVEASFATVATPGRGARLFLRRPGRLGDADLFELRWRLRWSRQVRSILRRNTGSVDVAFVNTQASALLSRGPMRRLPTVLSIDATVRQFTALEYGGPRNRWSPRQDRILARLERRALERAAAVVAWTEWNAEAIRREHPGLRPPVVTLHPGLDASWWGEAAASRPSRSAGPLRLLFVGNDVERKGLDLLVGVLGRPEVDAVLDVVSGDEVAASDTVRVHRDVEAGSERLRDLYAAADVFVLPTRADAVPWSVLEAMAAGLPVVASRVGAIAELVGDAGVTVEPGNAEELEAALARLGDPELRRRLGERALARVRDRYDSAVQVPRLLEVLRGAAGRSTEDAGAHRMRRRTFVALGLGTAGALLVAPYVALVPGEEFEQMVAAKLGIETALAAQLLDRARAEYGDAEYDARAAAFAFAVRDPAALVLPDGLRERAISSLLEPMLSAPAASLAYGVTGVDPGGYAPCAGLVRDR